MAIIASDIIIKTMLESAIADLRANPWILEDVYSGLANDKLASPEAGWKEVKIAIDWFLNTDIPVMLQHRIGDRPRMPCITVAYMPSREMLDRTSLSDQGLIENYDMTSGRGTTMPLRVTKNFTPASYVPAKGLVTTPKGVDTDFMGAGQFLVSKVSGKSYEIKDIISKQSFKIAPNVVDDFTDCYVVPKSSVWNLHRELTFISESYSIGCHVSNDPASTIWLWQAVLYSVMRYKEAFLEGRGFVLSTWESSALERNPEFDPENIYSKYITLSGQVQADWIKFVAPKIQSVKGAIVIADGPKAPEGAYYEGVEQNPPAWSMPDDGFYVLGGEIDDDQT